MLDINDSSKSQKPSGSVTSGGTGTIVTDTQPRPQTNPTMKPGSNPTTGWASMGSTTAFRAINFELFMKPNKYVMAFGVLAFTSCVSYIVYMNVTDDKRKDSYVTLDEDGGLTVRKRTSRWY
ncbi:unnamed protein product [Candidula unifasciata]|uniref:Small integral membrane protein 8 n=1 Tax=Candidula unifasciata TaxID=100452 RepID=A0A8S3ZXQ2_9EUPU|nr:unnamed protein product [Candidula unifasciata]